MDKEFFSVEDVEMVGKVLQNEKEVLAARFRAAFVLRNIGGPEVFLAIVRTA